MHQFHKVQITFEIECERIINKYIIHLVHAEFIQASVSGDSTEADQHCKIGHIFLLYWVLINF